MSTQTIICGLALVVIGGYGYMLGSEHAENDHRANVAAWEADKSLPEPVMKSAKTALIPAGFGIALILCGAIVAVKPTPVSYTHLTLPTIYSV